MLCVLFRLLLSPNLETRATPSEKLTLLLEPLPHQVLVLIFGGSLTVTLGAIGTEDVYLE